MDTMALAQGALRGAHTALQHALRGAQTALQHASAGCHCPQGLPAQGWGRGGP